MSAIATTSSDVRGLGALFRPAAIAVVGASTDPGKLGAALCRSLAGFSGRVAAVNPRAEGMYATISDAAIDGPIDLVMVCVPAKSTPEVLAESAAAGARAAVVCGGGFAEAGDEGAGLQAQLAAVAAETGIRVLGPNTSGFLAPHLGLTASFVPAAAAVPAGRVAVVAASGGVNHAVSFLLAEAGHGVSLAVGLGNAVDVTAADVLDHLADDADTTAVALHIESVGDGRRLVEAVRRCSGVKPVVALVVGRNDVGAFAASHTGALATSWRVTRAALAQAGAVLVADERELVDAVGALSVTRLEPTAAPGVGVLTAQAGPGLLLLDDLAGRQILVPELQPETRDQLGTLLPPLTYQRNPVDTGRPGPEFDAVLAAVADDPGIELIAGYALDEPDAVDLVAAVGGAGVPVVFGVGGAGESVRATRAGLLARGIAVSDTPRGVAAATAALVADSQARHRAGPVERTMTPVARGALTGPLDEDQAKSLLEAVGFATPERRVCRDLAGAEAALAELGAPVAVKLLDAAVLHKTEIGGVHLGITTDAELAQALHTLDAAGATRYLVEAMAPAGVDLILGARRDAVFGPIVLLGLGGTTAEVLADVAVRLAPLSLADAAEMTGDLAGAALLDGWRGGPRLDRAALADAISALGSLLLQHPNLLEVEINPLRVIPDGIVALDAVVRTAEVS